MVLMKEKFPIVNMTKCRHSFEDTSLNKDKQICAGGIRGRVRKSKSYGVKIVTKLFEFSRIRARVTGKPIMSSDYIYYHDHRIDNLLIHKTQN